MCSGDKLRGCQPGDSQTDGGGDGGGGALCVRTVLDEAGEGTGAQLTVPRLVEQLPERPERHPLAVGRTTPGQHTDSSLERRAELQRQPRLADAGLAHDRAQPRPSLPDHRVQDASQRQKLPPAAHHRGCSVRHERLGGGAHVRHPPGVEAVLALGGQLHGLDRHAVADETASGVADHQFAVPGRTQEPIRELDGPAGCGGGTDVGLAEHYLAGVDADACCGPHTLGRAVAHRRQSLPERRRRPDGAPGIVLTGLRYAEHRDQHPTDEPLDRAPVTPDRVGGELVYAAECGTERLDLPVARRGQRGGGAHREFREHDRDHLPSLGQPRPCDGGRLVPQHPVIWGVRAEVQRGVVREDGALEPPEPWGGLDTELVNKGPTCGPVGIERVRLSTRPVQRSHQVFPQPLAEGVFGDQRLEVAHDLDVTPGREFGRETLLDRAHTGLIQRGDRGLRERLMGELAEGGPTPQVERRP